MSTVYIERLSVRGEAQLEPVKSGESIATELSQPLGAGIEQ
jgi:hypothetical protein